MENSIILREILDIDLFSHLANNLHSMKYKILFISLGYNSDLSKYNRDGNIETKMYEKYRRINKIKK